MLSKIIFTFLIMLSLSTYVKAKAPDEWIAEQESKGNVKHSKVNGISYIKVTEVYDGLGTNMKQEQIYEVLPSGEKKVAARKVIIINPYELRELEFGNKYWMKNDPSTNGLQDTYNSFLKEIDANFVQNAGSGSVEADKKPLDCIKTLMSEPSCIDRLNATNACKNRDHDEEYIKLIQGCITQMSKPGDSASRKNNTIAMCLGGFSSSSKVSTKETYCNGETSRPIFINDSAKNKLKETQPLIDSTPKNKSSVDPK